MKSNLPVLECVPNVSHGANDHILQLLIEAINAVPGQKLLHVDCNLAANRSVFTFAGEPEAVVRAAFQLFKTAAKYIDMLQQKGAHPRIGAVDVCPLVPLYHCSRKEAVYWADVLGKMVTMNLKIPVYLYEFSAKKSYRRALPNIRKGEYEGLFSKMQSVKWRPDYNDIAFHLNKDFMAKTGASVIGARNILVACNISLNTKDKTIAGKIARQIRSSGYWTHDREQNKWDFHAGMFPALRAIGWYIEDFECAQVSMNLLDYKKTSLVAVWNAVKELAKEYGCEATGCEVIGLIPERCIWEAGKYAMDQEGSARLLPKESYIEAGIQYLGLTKVKPFDPQEKVLEYALRNAGLLSN